MNPFQDKPRVFVVDDDAEIAKMLAVVLQMNLFDAVAFADPVQALAAAKLDPPEYLITDIVMPGMNGIELAIAMQRDVPSSKVMLFSGDDSADRMIEAAAGSGHNFSLARKPLHPTKLVAALQNL